MENKNNDKMMEMSEEKLGAVSGGTWDTSGMEPLPMFSTCTAWKPRPCNDPNQILLPLCPDCRFLAEHKGERMCNRKNILAQEKQSST